MCHIQETASAKAALEKCLSSPVQENEDESNVIGGLMFSCAGRGEDLLGGPGTDSQAFSSAFPKAQLAVGEHLLAICIHHTKFAICSLGNGLPWGDWTPTNIYKQHWGRRASE